MAALVAYVAVQPLRYNQATLAEKQGADVSANSATKKGSLWMFAGRSLKNESIETLSAICCQTNRGAMGRNGGAGDTVIGGAMTDLSPVKSVASDESPYPAANLRNYFYSNPTSHQHLHLPPQHQRPRCAINMSHQQVSSVPVRPSERQRLHPHSRRHRRRLDGTHGTNVRGVSRGTTVAFPYSRWHTPSLPKM